MPCSQRPNVRRMRRSRLNLNEGKLTDEQENDGNCEYQCGKRNLGIVNRVSRKGIGVVREVILVSGSAHRCKARLIIPNEQAVDDADCDFPYERCDDKDNVASPHALDFKQYLCSSISSSNLITPKTVIGSAVSSNKGQEFRAFTVWRDYWPSRKIIMEKQQGEQEGQYPKRRRTQSKYNKESTRYECFCAKQYLSYPALYLHLKNKHPNYFSKTKGQNKVENTKLVESFDSNEGYRVLKIPVSDITMQEFDIREPFTGPNGEPLRHPDNTQLVYGNYMYHFPPVNFDYINANSPFKSSPFSFVSIEVAFSAFAQSITKSSATKQRIQTQLLLSLLIECLNGNYHRLDDQRTQGKEVRRYTAEFTSEYVSRIFSYFDKEYLPRIKKEEDKPYTFFMTHSHIITSESYKNVLHQLHDFLRGSLGQRDSSERQSGRDAGTSNSERSETNKSNGNNS